MISFSAVCLKPKFNMDFGSEIWLSNASVAPDTVLYYTTLLITLFTLELQTGFS